jgi:UDP-GlcNAc:undecaprenyl-phosphate GlcNAc-1-phosphate transferase
MEVSPYILYIVSFASALIISLLTAPQIITIAGRRQLYDVPDNKRKLHINTTPSMGGVAIFFAFIITSSLVAQTAAFPRWHFMVASLLLLFLTGLMDDLIALSAWKKLVAQLLPIVIAVVLCDIRLVSLHGLFGIGLLPYWTSVTVTIIGCAFFTNAFNFIDGIDGLAGSMGALYTFILGICLALTGNYSTACISFSLMGATLGFLRYNITPARLFMGDTGSLLLGFTISILCILFINTYDQGTAILNWIKDPQKAMLFCVALLSLPVADCIRVFAIRIGKGVSPFHADRNHLHYFLLDLGLKDLQATAAIIFLNLIMITTAFLLQDAGNGVILACLTLLSLLIFTMVYFLRKPMVEKK